MRLYEFTNSKIKQILEKDFILNGDTTFSISKGIVNINGGIMLDNNICQKLPIKFGEIKGPFVCSNNNLTTLENFPSRIDGSCVIKNNPLTSLIGSPSYISDTFRCDNCKLTSLEGGPRFVGKNFYISHNPLTSLDGLPEEINGFIMLSFYDDMPVLKLLLIKGLIGLSFNPLIGNSATVGNILKKYLGKGKAGIIQCAAELTKAGFKRNARL